MAYSILVVDSDQAFATILKEGLEETGEYQVTLTYAGADALEAVVERPFDMVIVDMGLSDVGPVRLVKAIREAKPSMRLMLIPLIGQEIPRELQDLEIQGVLPKPFFVGDLPNIVGKTMSAEVAAPPTHNAPELKVSLPARPDMVPVSDIPSNPPAIQESPAVGGTSTPSPAETPPTETPTYPPEMVAQLQAKEQQIVGLLKTLNREVRAESIMVTLGAQLVAFSGLFSREQTAKLASLVAESTDAAAQAAAFLGEPEGRFEQSLHEGADYRLYSLILSEGLVLSLALSTAVPLGTLRYRVRQTAEELLELLS